MANLTLANISALNQKDTAVIGIMEEATKNCPEAKILPVRVVKGVSSQFSVRTALPTVAFRAANAGSAGSKSTYVARTVDLAICNPVWTIDEEVARADERGWEALFADEGIAHMEAALFTISKNFYYGTGTGGDASGCLGLVDFVDSGMVLDAGGTTATTASSVWLVRAGAQDTHVIVGNGGQFEMGEPKFQFVADGSGNLYNAILGSIKARIGIQTNPGTLARIRDITADSGKGLTDILLANAVNLFPAGRPPTHIFMNRRSLGQLQASRTTYSPTGAPAPMPVEWNGIPIVVTDALSNTEALS